MTAINRAAPADFPTIHWIKAAAIIAVVFNHAGPARWSSDYSGLDLILRQSWVSFHIPAFIFVSVFLYYRGTPITIRNISKRVLRILVPYTIASLVMLASGRFPLQFDRSIWFVLATGSAIGIYYYVFIIINCVLALMWPISRLPRYVPLWMVGSSLVYFALGVFQPWILYPHDWFWATRNPLFYAHYFLAGWLVRGYLGNILRFLHNYQKVLRRIALIAICTYLIGSIGSIGRAAVMLARAGYTVSVVGMLAAWNSGRPAPTLVRWLSNATFPFFLYHYIAIVMLRPHVMGLEPLARILVLVMAALAFGGTITIAGRHLFGDRSRYIIGA